MIKRILCLFLAAVMLASFASCTLEIKAEELSAGYTRQASETGEVTEEFRQAMANFAMELFRRVAAEERETSGERAEAHLVSPLSAMVCLCMEANGAAGETLSQMEAALGMDIDRLNRCLYAYTSSLYTAKDCKFSLADSIWFRDQADAFRVEPSFLQTNADWYGAQVYAAPFDESTVRDINNWCKKHTDGMIPEIVDVIERDTVMYLINALAFDAKWAEAYEKGDIYDGRFTNRDGSSADVSYLHSMEYTYLSDVSLGVTGFARPYAGKKYSFVGLLPEEGKDIYDVIDALSGEGWMALWASKGGSVSVALPEFTFDAHIVLNNALKDMGMVDMFDAGVADFSRLGQAANGPVYCSAVEQKTYVQVDRHGTKAAAVTWATNDSKECAAAGENSVILDRPFLYAIVDNTTGLPLFIGAVTHLS